MSSGTESKRYTPIHPESITTRSEGGCTDSHGTIRSSFNILKQQQKEKRTAKKKRRASIVHSGLRQQPARSRTLRTDAVGEPTARVNTRAET